MNKNECDFSGWATKNNLVCSDGRRIKKNAFIEDDGKIVPLVWNHQYDSIDNVLGHALLENREEGVYAYGFFNDTEAGQNAKKAVDNGDIVALSIFANKLKHNKVENVRDVVHGSIKELSLVLAGANPGAFIDNVVLAHSEEVNEEEAIIYTGEDIVLAHSENEQNNEEEKKEMADEKKEKTIGDILDTLNEEQRQAVEALVGLALEEGADEEDEEIEEEVSENMKHNVFDQDTENRSDVLSHSDMKTIFDTAKRNGSLREAVEDFCGEDGELRHSIDTTGMDTPVGEKTYGINDASMFFPDPTDVNKTPEFISRNMDWVADVMANVHRSPFSRIRSRYANITEDAARAKGYITGTQKKTEVFTTLKRVTDPQTVYKYQKMDRDDVLDITDFDVVAWIKGEMRVMLDEEVARAILIGDGRESDDPDKISESHVRPVVKDVPLYNTTVKVAVANNATDAEVAKAIINSFIRSRKHYKGSGNPTLYTTEDWLTEMLLLEDSIGHKLYKTVAELATALRVKNIVTVEPMENAVITEGTGQSAVSYPLIGTVVNLRDYTVGADKGGDVGMFDDFDIKFNQYEYLIEKRCSGALTKPFSAITLVLNRAANAPAG